jgi:hypothetical protein
MRNIFSSSGISTRNFNVASSFLEKAFSLRDVYIASSRPFRLTWIFTTSLSEENSRSGRLTSYRPYSRFVCRRIFSRRPRPFDISGKGKLYVHQPFIKPSSSLLAEKSSKFVFNFGELLRTPFNRDFLVCPVNLSLYLDQFVFARLTYDKCLFENAQKTLGCRSGVYRKMRIFIALNGIVTGIIPLEAVDWDRGGVSFCDSCHDWLRRGNRTPRTQSDRPIRSRAPRWDIVSLSPH